MADNLESYFKKKLSEDTPGDENWNVPSDKVWENVLPEIQKKRGLFIPWRYLYMLGILLIAGLISVVWLVNTNDNTEIGSEPIVIVDAEESNVITRDSESKKTNDVNELYENTTSLQKPAVDVNETISEELELENTSEKSTVGKGENISANSAKESSSEYALTEVVSNTASLNTTTLNLEAQNSFPTGHIQHNNKGEVEQINQITNLSIEDISAPVALTIEEQKAEEISSEDVSQSNLKEPLNNKGRFGIGAYIVPAFNSTSVIGEPLQGAIETSNMLMYSTNWGFELRYHISNRFTLVTGIGKSEIKSWSKSYTEFGYDTSTEDLMPTGEKQNTSPVPMQTPFGEIDTEITFQFAGSEEFPDGEPMQSSIETHQDVRYLSIPLGVEFNIIRFSRFNWFTEGGVRYNRAMKDATQFTSRVLHNGDDMDVVSEKLMGSPSYTENYLSFYVGTGLNYQISKSFQLSGSARYFGNITKVNLQDNMSTYVQGFDFKVGIIFIF